MLELFFIRAEKELALARILIYSFLTTFVLGIVNHFFVGSNALFLVALTSLALAYPVISYVRREDREEITKQMRQKTLIHRHADELLIFCTIFLGILLALSVLMSQMDMDYTYQEAVVHALSGNATQMEAPFSQILLNNLTVFLITFFLSVISFSALIFIIVWNASVIAYYLSTLAEYHVAFLTGVSLMGHGLLEVGGYILAGIAGSLISMKFDYKLAHRKTYKAQFWVDTGLMLGAGVLLILLGAFVEVL